MTITSPSMQRLAGLAMLVLCVAPAAAMAQQRQQQAQQPNYQPNYNAIQSQQANQQAILQDKLRTNQLLEEQRQRNAAAIRQPQSGNPAASQALDLSNQAQQQRFDARQRDVVDQYRAASSTAPVVLPQPVRQSTPKKPPPSALDQLHPTPPQQQPTQSPPQR